VELFVANSLLVGVLVYFVQQFWSFWPSRWL